MNYWKRKINTSLRHVFLLLAMIFAFTIGLSTDGSSKDGSNTKGVNTSDVFIFIDDKSFFIEAEALFNEQELSEKRLLGEIGRTPSSAIVPLAFGHDNNLLTAQEYNTWLQNDSLERKVSLFAFTNFASYEKLIHHKVALGLLPKRPIKKISKEHIWGISSEGDYTPDSTSDELVIFVFDPYEIDFSEEESKSEINYMENIEGKDEKND